MTTQTLTLFQALRSVLTDDGAKAVIDYLNENMETIAVKQVNMRIEHLATGEDLSKIKEDLVKLGSGLECRLSEAKAELTKWMFIFIMGQTALLAGLMKFMN